MFQMRNPNNNDSPWRLLGWFGVAGMNVAICVVIGYFLGKWLSEWLGGGPIWSAVGALTGLVVGVVNIVYFIKKLTEETDG
ncbi:AtpZ/AtpI family protein [Paenibacillus sp. IB182363]|uniref:AtpZ/AtpI family protein n=2 Tax=Paenibacillus oceani TaxID=2772510 RepID=A0A927H0X2_9BACL|nr:AtpZ/AtpI family protein [Paenibacillus oceani]